jgi:hypothetical protein
MFDLCCYWVMGHQKMWLWVSMGQLQDGHFGEAVLLMQMSLLLIGNHLSTKYVCVVGDI